MTKENQVLEKDQIKTPKEDEVLKIKNVVGDTGSYEVNPTSISVGYVTILGPAPRVETFIRNLNLIRVRAAVHPIFVEFARDEVNFGKRILMRGDLDEVQFFPVNVRAVRFTNVITDGTRNGSYELVGFL